MGYLKEAELWEAGKQIGSPKSLGRRKGSEDPAGWSIKEKRGAFGRTVHGDEIVVVAVL